MRQLAGMGMIKQGMHGGVGNRPETARTRTVGITRRDRGRDREERGSTHHMETWHKDDLGLRLRCLRGAGYGKRRLRVLQGPGLPVGAQGHGPGV